MPILLLAQIPKVTHNVPHCIHLFWIINFLKYSLWKFDIICIIFPLCFENRWWLLPDIRLYVPAFLQHNNATKCVRAYWPKHHSVPIDGIEQSYVSELLCPISLCHSHNAVVVWNDVPQMWKWNHWTNL